MTEEKYVAKVDGIEFSSVNALVEYKRKTAGQKVVHTTKEVVSNTWYWTKEQNAVVLEEFRKTGTITRKRAIELSKTTLFQNRTPNSIRTRIIFLNKKKKSKKSSFKKWTPKEDSLISNKGHARGWLSAADAKELLRTHPCFDGRSVGAVVTRWYSIKERGGQNV
jgi:hypothetical protein